jgi:hypothetical protein
MTTLDESRTVAQTRKPSEDDTARPEAQAWQLGILTDRAGHVHLGAVVAGNRGEPDCYVDLLAPIGAGCPGDLDLARLVILVRGNHIADLRRLAERCIEDARLKQHLMELIALAVTR